MITVPPSGSVSPPGQALRILVVVPVYNHSGTLRQVVQTALAQHNQVLVADDGSTDMPPAHEGHFPPHHPLYGLPALYLRHPRNLGKGAAIQSAARHASALGMTHIITIDADGQHDPEELPRFINAIAEYPSTLLMGARAFPKVHVPFSSRFGRAFSNFWFTVQTGQRLADTQCGYRAYPLSLFRILTFTENRYSFEVEVTVRAVWAGFAVRDIPVSVHYPSKDERISHFKAIADNVRISLLNTRLTIRAIMPIPQKKIKAAADGKITPLHPLQSLSLLLARAETPQRLALAGAMGMFIGALPLIGMHSILILLCAGLFRLNPLTGLAVSQLCIPPFVPALCIETGHFIRHGALLTDMSLRTLGYEALDRLWEWVLGSIFLAPIGAALMGITIYLLALTAQKTLRVEAAPSLSAFTSDQDN